MSILTEAEIADLLADPKPVTARELKTLLNPRQPKNGDLCAYVYVTSKHHRKFQLTARLGQSGLPNEFSVHLSHGHGKHRRNLIRCDGYQVGHTNHIEKRLRAGIQKVAPNTCHIHTITERYQRSRKPDGYAEPTTEFWDFTSAVHFLCDNYGCYDPASEYPGGKRHSLF